MIKLVSVVFFSFMAICSSAIAQTYTISGFIKDAENGETLLGANVYVKKDVNKNTATNNYGFYSLSLPAGDYVLVYTYLGFQDQEKVISLKEDQKFNVDLKVIIFLFSKGNPVDAHFPAM